MSVLRVCLVLLLVCAASLGQPLGTSSADPDQDAGMTEVLLEASDNVTIVDNTTVIPLQESSMPVTDTTSINVPNLLIVPTYRLV
jgi:ABC-type phosphate transport system substrate-binding protein